MSSITYLDFCLKFFNKIYAIQQRGLYSHAEVSNLMREIESVLDKIKEKNQTQQLLDWYSREFNPEYQLTWLRYTFHQHLKRAGKDPLKTLV
ncbi:hypothetical protein LCGC14_0762180 [marine sediment metagenome]|uniref:Uncharacterized protein n=1 Tax=marine sediment metagenome TaxID=412755 RepID=A0A0F9T7U9_9ZZZZ